MVDLVNLRRARKARDRDAASAQAESRRAVHGRTKARNSATPPNRRAATHCWMGRSGRIEERQVSPICRTWRHDSTAD
ncbi:DUF4169 family protein [uncultured Sphingomonas sp.]|uniref:DUF4169 family protein n=1 Tax=uncultured Sphingomonas sp. TaxID=158754 RepID=UPI0035CC94A8